MEELVNWQERTHLLNVPARTASNIDPDRLLVQLAALGLVLDLRGNEAEHVLAAIEESGSGRIVDAGLALIEALEGVLLLAARVAGVRLEEAGPDETSIGAKVGVDLARGLELGEGANKVGDDDQCEQDRGEADLAQRAQQHFRKCCELHGRCVEARERNVE